MCRNAGQRLATSFGNQIYGSSSLPILSKAIKQIGTVTSKSCFGCRVLLVRVQSILFSSGQQLKWQSNVKNFETTLFRLFLQLLISVRGQSSWQRHYAHNLEVEGSSPVISLKPYMGERRSSIGRAGKIRNSLLQVFYSFFILKNKN